jgi:hypothetical protein
MCFVQPLCSMSVFCLQASAPLKRRIRIKKRPVADDFETAESQNIAAAAQNSLSSVKIPEKKVNAVKEIILLSATPSLITSTTTTTEIPATTTAPEVAETVTARGTETTPPTPDELTTVSDVATTTTPEAETTTDEQVTHILGTSTTTEISLETEICYKGRCIKTKVDADQNPIE